MDSTIDQLEGYWIEQKVARGLSPPVRVTNARAAKELVASRPGGIAYIPIADADDTVRALEMK
jgi:hypothetical protein